MSRFFLELLAIVSEDCDNRFKKTFKLKTKTIHFKQLIITTYIWYYKN